MNKATKILTFIGIISLSSALSLKKNLSQSINGSILECIPLACDCTVTPPGEGFPMPGNATLVSYGSGALISEGAFVSTVPDTSSTATCETQCCACSRGTHESSASAARTRHWDVDGYLGVCEAVVYASTGNSSSSKGAHFETVKACANTNIEGNATSPGGNCVTVCN